MAETADFEAVFDALSASGAADRHPVRFVYLDALARRAAGQPEPMRQLLNARISAAASELNASPGNLLTKDQPTVTASPLAELLAYIDQQNVLSLNHEFDDDSIFYVDRHGSQVAQRPLQAMKSERWVRRIEFQQFECLAVLAQDFQMPGEEFPGSPNVTLRIDEPIRHRLSGAGAHQRFR